MTKHTAQLLVATEPGFYNGQRIRRGQEFNFTGKGELPTWAVKVGSKEADEVVPEMTQEQLHAFPIPQLPEGGKSPSAAAVAKAKAETGLEPGVYPATVRAAVHAQEEARVKPEATHGFPISQKLERDATPAEKEAARIKATRVDTKPEAAERAAKAKADSGKDFA